MNSKLRAFFNYRGTHLPTRVIVSVLLFLIVYGSTVSAVHEHVGSVLKVTTTAEASVTESSSSNPTNKPSPAGDDCLICQFHQHLTSGLLSAPEIILAPLAGTALVSKQEFSYLSAFVTAQRGRGPPFTSLT